MPSQDDQIKWPNHRINYCCCYYVRYNMKDSFKKSFIIERYLKYLANYKLDISSNKLGKKDTVY